MWRTTTQCKSGIFLLTSHGSIEEAYSVSTHSLQRPLKGATQWNEGGPHSNSSKVFDHRGRSLVRSIVLKCVTCRRFEGRPFNAPSAPPLPSFRVNEAPPFMYTAIDFAGPIYLNSRELDSSKVWICLFTCCVVRVIHLELVPDMTTTTFILKRFSARRGYRNGFSQVMPRHSKQPQSRWRPFSTTRK
jgi:hypothetical protein